MISKNTRMRVMQHHFLRFLLFCFCNQLILAPAVMAQTIVNPNPAEVGGITLSFVNADVESVASVVAKATSQTILVDPQVKGVITLVSNKPVSKSKALDSFSTALRANGFALVETSGIYRVVTQADAKLVSTSVTTGKGKQEGDQIITRVFKLNHESANNLLPVLRPLVSPNNTVNAYPGNNTIVVTDYASNIQRIATLIESIDTPTSTDVQTIKLQYAFASDVAAILTKVLDTGLTGGADPTLKTIILAEPRSNSILIRSSSAERVRQVRILVVKLDTPGNRNGNIWVVPLKNAEASKLAVTLRALVAADAALSAQVASSSNAAPNAPVANPQQAPGTTGALSAQPGSGTNLATSALTSSSNPNIGGFIQAEPATNSILITGSEPLYRNLRQVIEELDRRRTQVYIESVIVEVSNETAAELGIQWNFLLGSGNQNVGFGSTNYNVPGQGPGANIFGLNQNVNNAASGGTGIIVPPAPGLNLGVISRFNGVYAMSALIRALQTASGTNILSTPNLITLDNEEARIIVGQNVPILTGSYSTTGSSTTVTPFQTFVRQDVGITLRVKPQISDNGIVKMQIFQEVSAVAAQTTSGIVLNKRNIESNVLVDDGQMIVLGGLISDEYADGSSGIPFLSSIPILGNLFRYDNKNRVKRNLLVFIRPYVLRDKAQSDEITNNRLSVMQNQENQFKQLPMLLPTEKDMPSVSNAEIPMVPPRLPASTINTSPAIRQSVPGPVTSPPAN